MFGTRRRCGALAEIVTTLGPQFPDVATMLTDACEDLLAFTHFPLAQWRKIWSTNPLERLNGEIKRRTNVVGIFLRVSLVVGEELGVTRNLSVEPSALTLLGPVPSAPSEWSSDLIAA